MSDIDPPGVDRARHALPLAVAALLTAAPPLLAYTQPPSANLLNQQLAVAAWGGLVLALAPGRVTWRTWPLQAALVAMIVGVLWSWWPGSLPTSLALSALGTLAAAMVVAWAGGEAARQRDAVTVFAAFSWGVLLAGLLSAAVALLQVFAADWTAAGLVSRSHLAGRAVGNLRQPNHLCSLLLWAVIATVALHELRRLPSKWTVAVIALLVFAVELSASRTGAAGLVLLASWGAFARSLSRPMRALLVLTPVIYAASYGVMLAWGEWAHQVVGAEARLAGASPGIESANSRRRIWANAVEMITAQPWTGVGFGEFNLAWSLTPFENRPTAYFDHTHNLPLQLAVELGLPLAGLVMALLVLAFVHAWRRGRRAGGDRGLAASAAMMMVLMIGVHSLVEYPLWYAYFLLPTALAWGFALGAADAPTLPVRESLGGALAGAALVIAAGLAYLDYQRVTPIYGLRDRHVPMAERVDRGQRSVLFDYYADFGAATNPELGLATPLAFERAPHNLLDTRLMVAWARHLAASGQVELARTLVQRIREFRGSDAAEFLGACSAPGPADFQCQAPQSTHTWRDFLAR